MFIIETQRYKKQVEARLFGRPATPVQPKPDMRAVEGELQKLRFLIQQATTKLNIAKREGNQAIVQQMTAEVQRLQQQQHDLMDRSY